MFKKLADEWFDDYRLNKSELRIISDLIRFDINMRKVSQEDKDFYLRLAHGNIVLPVKHVFNTKGCLREYDAAHRLADKGILFEVDHNKFVPCKDLNIRINDISYLYITDKNKKQVDQFLSTYS